MNPIEEFQQEKKDSIFSYHDNFSLRKVSQQFTEITAAAKYHYNFSWFGRPTIHYPQDLAPMQEIIWNVKPDLIIETGIAHRGSLIFSASMLELLGGDNREVLGLDVDMRAHNRAEIWCMQLPRLTPKFLSALKTNQKYEDIVYPCSEN